VRERNLASSNSLKIKGAQSAISDAPPPDLGTFVRQQIEAKKNGLSPIDFTTPSGRRGHIWLAYSSDGKPKVGDDRHFRVHIEKLIELNEKRVHYYGPWPRPVPEHVRRIEGSAVPLQRLTANPPAREPNDVQPDTWPRPWGWKVRVCIGAEKELQELGCGWRVVAVELDGNQVHLNHNGRMVTMRRKAFREFLTANRKLRKSGRYIKPAPYAGPTENYERFIPQFKEVLKPDHKPPARTNPADYPELPSFLDRRKKLRLLEAAE
jgi:hypothetical protein